MNEIDSAPIAYRANRGDWGRLRLYAVTNRRPWLKIYFIVLWLAATVPALLTITTMYRYYVRYGPHVFARIPQHTMAAWLMFAIVFPAFVLFLHLFVPLMARTANAREPAERSVSVAQSGVTHRAGGIDVTTSWRSIQDVRFDRGATYFFTGKFNAIVIPARAFAGKKIARAFSDSAAALWQVARNSYADIFAQPFQVAYMCEQADLLELCLKVRKDYRLTNPAGLLSILCLLGFFACYILMINIRIVGLGFQGFLTICCALVILVTIGFFVDPITRLLRKSRKTPGALDPMEVVINEAGVFHRSAAGEKFRPWREITRIAASRNLIAIECDGGEAIAIPKRAFPAPQAADYFEYAARAYKEMRIPEPVGTSWPPVPITGI